MRQFDDELLVEGIKVRLAVEAHDGDATTPLNAHIVELHSVFLPSPADA